MNPLTKNIIFNIHPASLLLSVGSVLAGLAASIERGGVALLPAVLTILVAVLFQISANLYYGYRRANKWVAAYGHVAKETLDPMGYKLMQILSNVTAILAVTMAFPLFTRMGWLAICYLVVIVVGVYFHFGGTHPLVRTRWSLIVTFLLFGPIAVSGTAMIQNHYQPVNLPIILYSIISGLLSVNAHLSIQYVRIRDDVKDGMTSLLSTKGPGKVRNLYAACVIAICILMVVFPLQLGLPGVWPAVVIDVLLIGSAAYVCRLMGQDSLKAAMRLRVVVMIQYIVMMAVMLCIVFYPLDFWVTLLGYPVNGNRFIIH